MISKEKREIIQVLESYSALLSAEKNLSERISTLEKQSRSGSGYPELYSYSNVEHLFLLSELVERLERIRKEIEWIERSLSVLPEDEEQLIRNEFFTGKTVPAISGKHGNEKSSFYRLRSKALSHFALGYDGSIV